MSTQFMSTGNSIQYAPPTLADVDQLHDFFFAMLHENFSYFPEPARAYYGKAWDKNALEQRIILKQGLLTCAWNDSKIIGFISGTPPEGGVATVIWLTVTAVFQSLGVGKQLLTTAKEFYQQTMTHKIKLTAHDERAIQFYLREGFIQEAWHRNHWWGLDFAAMALFLA